MKKVISVSMVVAILFAFSACSPAGYVDTPVTVTVTDANGEAVTNEKGEAVTEVVTDENGNTMTETKKSTSADKASGNTTAKNSGNSNVDTSNNNGGENNNNNNSNNNNIPDKSATTKPVTAKPKKRDVTITVNMPFYNKVDTNITLYYSVNGEEYVELEKRAVTLDDNKKTEKFAIEDVKGEISAYITFKDRNVDITKNSVTISADKEEGSIIPVTGIEIMDGGMD